MPARALHISPILIIVTVLFSACSITVTGKISVKGNDPHVFPVLTASDNTEYIITGANGMILMDSYQGKTVTVKGILSRGKKNLYQPAELEVIEIISLQGE